MIAPVDRMVRLGILALGRDPGISILHSEQKSRDSFVYDVIEQLRPRRKLSPVLV
jgi:CRISPR/Cas system-associated endonuclease Cas1